jgi:uridine kinase
MQEIKKLHKENKITKKVIDFCLGKYKFIFISGNGGSGKTTFAKKLVEEVNLRGLKANYIDTDEFMIDTEIRKNSKIEWIDNKNNKRISDHGSVFKEAYHLDSLETIIHSLLNNKDSSYKSKNSKDLIELKSDATINIIEGIASAFIEKNDMIYSILITCDINIEIDRRINRARNNENNLTREAVQGKCAERREQFEITVLSEKNKFDLELFSLEDYSFMVGRDDLNVL